MPLSLEVEDYDAILDALDSEDTNTVLKRFQLYDLNPHSDLLDNPRIGHNNIEINTYLDYAISYNLTNIIDIFIDELNLEITDEILSRTLTLQNHDTYKYFCELGYHPEVQTLKNAVQLCCSGIVDSILEYDSDLIHCIDEDDIEYIFKCDMDEETIETVRVLFNYGAKCDIFKDFLYELREFNNCGSNSECEQNIAIEIIDILECNGVE